MRGHNCATKMAASAHNAIEYCQLCLLSRCSSWRCRCRALLRPCESSAVVAVVVCTLAGWRRIQFKPELAALAMVSCVFVSMIAASW